MAMLIQQTRLIQSLVEQLWNSKLHPGAIPSSSGSGASLSSLPIELIELVLANVDTDTLFKLCRVNRLLRALAQPRLISHAQQITMRLWINQPHVVSHKPIDFTWSACDTDNNRMVFEPQDNTTMTLQTALPPPQIDGCTVLIKVHNTRRIYSISYKDRIVPVPIQPSQQHTIITTDYESATGNSSMDVEDAYACGWSLSYDVHDDSRSPAIKYLHARSFACDTDLLDPQVLIASSREKVVVSLPESTTTSTTSTTSEDSHDEKKKMMMQNGIAPSPSWLSRIVNDTMVSFYQWVAA
ncbi:hypothetical protein BDB00DRAFT_835976 [Zychaea mexicana]|uniref:uncharacterized protein n=1 Tax=Zychaea mexicana TaxID=64656 RepID=UPI0022FE4347|nr:uncharacterized protein BDB00DRAFT_835976 [Zychaea mexicana]KAI9490922.1 hypothetical protein BDB00DRAFT_835976 [Zychaea mexicana]